MTELFLLGLIPSFSKGANVDRVGSQELTQFSSEEIGESLLQIKVQINK